MLSLTMLTTEPTPQQLMTNETAVSTEQLKSISVTSPYYHDYESKDI